MIRKKYEKRWLKGPSVNHELEAEFMGLVATFKRTRFTYRALVVHGVLEEIVRHCKAKKEIELPIYKTFEVYRRFYAVHVMGKLTGDVMMGEETKALRDDIDYLIDVIKGYKIVDNKINIGELKPSPNAKPRTVYKNRMFKYLLSHHIAYVYLMMEDLSDGPSPLDLYV